MRWQKAGCKGATEQAGTEHIEFQRDSSIEMIAHSTKSVFYRKKATADDFKN
ncbi:MAG: hypothetical protein QM401_03390 [Bacillota bacterium]|nr:hypothetical protein [Bacillota bacterium]HHU61219.1 hypothetical protein [Natronincola sp.]